jgi:hypothetical protein
LVGAIWLAVAFSVAIPVLMMEDRRGTSALGRSFRLVRGRWWATFAAFLVAYLILAVVSVIVAALLVGALFTGVENQVVGAIVYGAGNVLAMVITTPLIAAVATVIYFDLRVRKEGLDLRQELGEEQGLEPSAGFAAGPAPSEQAPPPGQTPPAEGAGGFLPPAPPAPAEAPERPDSAPPPGPASPGR